MKRHFALALAVLLTAATMAGCSGGYSGSASTAAEPTAEAAPRDSANYSAGGAYGESEDYAVYDDYDTDYEYDLPDMEEGDAPETGGPDTGGGLGGGVTVQDVSTDDRKIVITVDLSLQTMEFESGTQDIVALTNDAGGYVQDSYVEGSSLYDKYMSRSASYTVRIPKERLNDFLAAVADKFNVVNERQSSTDISMQYFDNRARLESLRVQEERLMAMLAEADELKYMLQVEQELANVLYEIERITSSLNRMDDSVDLSTVTIYLQEVVQYEDTPPVKPATFGERISYTFGDSWDSFVGFCQGVVLFLVALVPFLPVLLVIAVVVFLLVRRSRKRRKERAATGQAYRPVYTIPQPTQQPQQPQQPTIVPQPDTPPPEAPQPDNGEDTDPE